VTNRSAKQACFVFEKTQTFFPPKTYHQSQRYDKDKDIIHSMKRDSSAHILTFMRMFIYGAVVAAECDCLKKKSSLVQIDLFNLSPLFLDDEACFILAFFHSSQFHTMH
jgi:hypothetical protein